MHRRPSGGLYGSVVRVEAPGMPGGEELPGVMIPVAEVLAWHWYAAGLGGCASKAGAR